MPLTWRQDRRIVVDIPPSLIPGVRNTIPGSSSLADDNLLPFAWFLLVFFSLYFSFQEKTVAKNFLGALLCMVNQVMQRFMMMEKKQVPDRQRQL